MAEPDIQAQTSKDPFPSDYNPSPPDYRLSHWQSSTSFNGPPPPPPLLTWLPGPASHRLNRVKPSDRHDDSIKLGSTRNFWRKACWSPDGNLILANTESQNVDILQFGSISQKSNELLKVVQSLRSPSPVLETVWYPSPAYVDSGPVQDGQHEPNTTNYAWCFAHSSRDVPIRLVDSTNGSTRASYAIMNHVERYIGPHSIAFSLDLGWMYCGEWSNLVVFPLSSPGLNTHSSIPLIRSNKSSASVQGGQRGLVSALAVAPCPPHYLPASSLEEAQQHKAEIVAAGTFSGTIGLYLIQHSLLPPPTDHTANANRKAKNQPGDLAASSCLAGWSEKEGKGIHQLRFHPLSPHILFVSSRRSDSIYVYDTRYLLGDPSRWSFKPLSQPRPLDRNHNQSETPLPIGPLIAKLRRPARSTHQRLWFDIDWAGRMLASGDAKGIISIWKINQGRFMDQQEDGSQGVQLEPNVTWQAHDDTIGSVGFHPYKPWLLSVSGSRHWPNCDSSDSDSSNSDCSSDNESGDHQSSNKKRHKKGSTWFCQDSSLKVWDMS